MRAIGIGVGVPFSQPTGLMMDTDAQLYVDAASITDATEKKAINQWFLDVKGLGSTTNNTNFYSKFHAVYMISPTSLAAAIINAVNTGTYDGTAVNSPGFNDDGIDTGGGTAYIDTNYNAVSEAAAINNFSFGWRNSVVDSFTRNPMGSRNVAALYASQVYTTKYSLGIASTFQEVTASAPQVGVGIVTKLAAGAINGYHNYVLIAAGTAATTGFFSGNIYLLGSNSNGAASGLKIGGQKHNFFWMAEGLTANEVEDMTDAVETYSLNVISGGR